DVAGEVEVPDLGRDPRREGGGVEAGDRPDAAGAGQLRAEEPLDGVPQRGDDAHAGDDDAPHAGSPLASSPLPWGERGPGGGGGGGGGGQGSSSEAPSPLTPLPRGERGTRADSPHRFGGHWPPSDQRLSAIAAQWPRSVPASLSRHGRRAAPGSRRTNTGH